MGPSAEYIKRLMALQEGERSRLRTLAGRRLDATVQAFDLFTGLWWPLREKSPAAPRLAPAWLVAKLFGAHGVPHVRSDLGAGSTLPEVLGRLEPRKAAEGRRFRTRFDALLCSPLWSLEPHLHWGLRQVARAVAGHVPHGRDVRGIDWVQLLDDLSIWDRGGAHRRGRDVREIWAEGYLNAAWEAERRT